MICKYSLNSITSKICSERLCNVPGNCGFHISSYHNCSQLANTNHRANHSSGVLFGVLIQSALSRVCDNWYDTMQNHRPLKPSAYSSSAVLAQRVHLYTQHARTQTHTHTGSNCAMTRHARFPNRVARGSKWKEAIKCTIVRPVDTNLETRAEWNHSKDLERNIETVEQDRIY